MKLALSAALMVLLTLAVPSHAEDTTNLQKIKAARAMYDIGLDAGDPLLILAAAKLRKEVPLDPVERAPVDGTTGAGVPLEWQEMLSSAASLVMGDPTLEGLVEDIKAERGKGVTNGPVYSIAEIKSGGKDVYDNVPFDGGTYAEIYVEGPRGSDLNLIIRDAKGRLVCSDTDISAIAYCGWKPAQSGSFEITVQSERGGGRYSLMSN